MARSHPGQLSLFDDFALPIAAIGPLPETFFGPETAPPVAPGHPVPDRLVLAVPVGGKVAGEIVSVAEAAALRHGLEVKVHSPFSLYVSVQDFGPIEALDDDEMESLIAVGGELGMRRFEIGLPMLGELDRGGLGLFVDDRSDELEEFIDRTRTALRERGVAPVEADRDGPCLPVAKGALAGGNVSLERPVRLMARDFALLRVPGTGDSYEILRKWPFVV